MQANSIFSSDLLRLFLSSSRDFLQRYKLSKILSVKTKGISACRKSSFRQAGRLPRNVQDDLFFVPKAYKGTPRGQKKVKTILKSHKVRHFVRFSVKIKLDNYLFFIVVKSVLLLLCVYRQSEKPRRAFFTFFSWRVQGL